MLVGVGTVPGVVSLDLIPLSGLLLLAALVPLATPERVHANRG